MTGEHIRGIPRTYEKEITLADTPYTLSLGYNCVKVDTTGGNVRVNLPNVNYPIDVIKTSSDSYIVTVWVGGVQKATVAGPLSKITIENAEVTKDEPWFPYDAIVGIAGVSGDGGEVLAKDRYGRKIASGTAWTDDTGFILNIFSTHKNIFLKDGTYTGTTELAIPTQCQLIGENSYTTRIEWAGVAGENVISSSTWPIRVKNIYIDCNLTAGCGINLSCAGHAFHNIIDDVVIIDYTTAGFYATKQDRPTFRDITAILNAVSAARSLYITTCTYPLLINCQGGQSTDVSVFVSYCNQPIIISGGSSGQVLLYRNQGGLIEGTDIECSVDSAKTVALSIGGESTYAPTTVLSSTIFNNHSITPKCVAAYDGVGVIVDGCRFGGSSLQYDLYASAGSHVYAKHNWFSSKAFYGGSLIHLQDNVNYITKSSGSSTGTGSEQPIAHNLDAIPVGCKAWITYLVGGRYVTEMVPFDATNIYPTVDNGVAYTWRIE